MIICMRSLITFPGLIFVLPGNLCTIKGPQKNIFWAPPKCRRSLLVGCMKFLFFEIVCHHFQPGLMPYLFLPRVSTRVNEHPLWYVQLYLVTPLGGHINLPRKIVRFELGDLHLV